jgi:hypothetical protein
VLKRSGDRVQEIMRHDLGVHVDVHHPLTPSNQE